MIITWKSSHSGCILVVFLQANGTLNNMITYGRNITVDFDTEIVACQVGAGGIHTRLDKLTINFLIAKCGAAYLEVQVEMS